MRITLLYLYSVLPSSARDEYNVLAYLSIDCIMRSTAMRFQTLFVITSITVNYRKELKFFF